MTHTQITEVWHTTDRVSVDGETEYGIVEMSSGIEMWTTFGVPMTLGFAQRAAVAFTNANFPVGKRF